MNPIYYLLSDCSHDSTGIFSIFGSIGAETCSRVGKHFSFFLLWWNKKKSTRTPAPYFFLFAKQKERWGADSFFFPKQKEMLCKCFPTLLNLNMF